MFNLHKFNQKGTSTEVEHSLGVDSLHTYCCSCVKCDEKERRKKKGEQNQYFHVSLSQLYMVSFVWL